MYSTHVVQKYSIMDGAPEYQFPVGPPATLPPLLILARSDERLWKYTTRRPASKTRHEYFMNIY